MAAIEYSTPEYKGPERRKKKREKDYQGPERGRSNRVPGVVVEYKVAGSDSALHGGFLKDISPTGLSILGAEKFEKGIVLLVLIYMFHLKEPVNLEAQVVWAKPSEYFKNTKIQHFDIGLDIIKISEENLQRLKKHAGDED